jgi:hypothetical protein
MTRWPVACDRDRDSPVADRKLDQRPGRLACQLDVERDVGRHLSRPFLVAIRERLVPAHRLMLACCGPGAPRSSGGLTLGGPGLGQPGVSMPFFLDLTLRKPVAA